MERTRHLVTKYGAVKLTVFTTLQSIILSVSVVLLAKAAFHYWDHILFTITLAASIPAVAVPFSSFFYFRLLERLDKTEREKAELVRELQSALQNVKTLKGLLPICASCKKIRDDDGYWQQVEVYLHKHSEAVFSHGICPECTKLIYPEFYKENKQNV